MTRPEPPWRVGASAGRPVQGHLTAQVALVGGGPAALAAALSLRRQGVDLALVEPGLRGRAAEHRGPGLALPGLAEHYFALCQSLGREVAARWWDTARRGTESLREALQEAGCPWERGALLAIAVNAAEMEEMSRGLADLQADGFEPRMMGLAAASNYVPVGEGEGALYLPGALAFDPGQALEALLNRLEALGGRLFCASPLVGWEQDAWGLHLHFPQGRLGCEVAVLADGLLPSDVGPGRWILPLRGQLLSTAPWRGGFRLATVAVTANRGHEIYRMLDDGGVVAAGLNPGSGPAEHTTGLEVDPVFQGFLEKFMGIRFAEARHAAIERRWAATYFFSGDGLPLVGSLPGHHRLFVATAFGTCSWSLGTAAGLQIAALLGGSPAAIPRGAQPRRFA
jgi:glycine/D-amino acid oxidase-like deaminating enzyme